MKRWLLVLVVLVLASCDSSDTAAPTSGLSPDEVKQIISDAEGNVDLSTAATLSYDFAGDVTEGRLTGIPLNGDLVLQGFDFSGLTIVQGTLTLDTGLSFQADGLIVGSEFYVNLSSEEGDLFIESVGAISADGSVSGPLRLFSGGISRGTFQATP